MSDFIIGSVDTLGNGTFDMQISNTPVTQTPTCVIWGISQFNFAINFSGESGAGEVQELSLSTSVYTSVNTNRDLQASANVEWSSSITESFGGAGCTVSALILTSGDLPASMQTQYAKGNASGNQVFSSAGAFPPTVVPYAAVGFLSGFNFQFSASSNVLGIGAAAGAACVPSSSGFLPSLVTAGTLIGDENATTLNCDAQSLVCTDPGVGIDVVMATIGAPGPHASTELTATFPNLSEVSQAAMFIQSFGAMAEAGSYGLFDAFGLVSLNVTSSITPVAGTNTATYSLSADFEASSSLDMNAPSYMQGTAVTVVMVAVGTPNPETIRQPHPHP